ENEFTLTIDEAAGGSVELAGVGPAVVGESPWCGVSGSGVAPEFRVLDGVEELREGIRAAATFARAEVKRLAGELGRGERRRAEAGAERTQGSEPELAAEEVPAVGSDPSEGNSPGAERTREPGPVPASAPHRPTRKERKRLAAQAYRLGRERRRGPSAGS